MADNVVDFNIRVNTDTGQVEMLKKSLTDVGNQAEKTGGSFKLAGQGASQLAQELGLVATVGGIIAFFKTAVDEAEKENEALRRLAGALEMNGISWKDNAEKVQSWGAAIQANTRFSDTEAFEAVGKLTRVTGDLASAQQASQVAMGLSVSSGKDLGATTELVTMLLNGNERAIKQVRNEYGSFIGNARTTQEVLDALNKQFSNSAQKEESFTKTTAQLKSAFSDFQETIGRAFIPTLTTVFKLFTSTIQKSEQLGSIIANLAMKFYAVAEMIARVDNAVTRLDFKAIPAAYKTMQLKLDAIEEGSVAQFAAMEKAKTAMLATELNTQQHLKSKAAEVDPKVIAEQRRVAAAKAAAEVKAEQDKAAKIVELERQLDQHVTQLGTQTLAKKIARMNLEVKAERDKIKLEVTDRLKRDELLAKIDQYRVDREAELTEQEVELKRLAAFQIADNAVAMLGILNSMGQKHNQAEANRAKAVLGLEKAIAIARAIAAAQVGGPFAGALAASAIALIAVQFAQQYKAIDEAAKEGGSTTSFSVNETKLPGGDTLIKLTGGDSRSQGGGGNQNSIGISLEGLGSGGSVGGGGSSRALGAGSGGEGGGVNVNLGGINITLEVSDLAPSERAKVLDALADEVRKRTVQAIRFAVASADLAGANASIAP